MLFYVVARKTSRSKEHMKTLLEVSCSNPLTQSKRAVILSVLTNSNSQIKQRVPQKKTCEIFYSLFIYLISYLFELCNGIYEPRQAA